MALVGYLKRNIFKANTYERVFGTEDGKFVLADLIGKYYVLKPTFVVGDPEQSILNEGMRKVVLDILYVLRTDPQILMDKLQEADEEDV